MRRLSASLIVLSAVAGCASTPPPPPVVVAKPEPPPAAPGPAPPRLEGGWRLAFLDGVSGQLAVGATLKLAPDAVNGLTASGFSGCGEFSTPATQAGVGILFRSVQPAPADATCSPEARSLETQYVSALSLARRLTIRGGYLVLIDDANRDKAYFVPG